MNIYFFKFIHYIQVNLPGWQWYSVFQQERYTAHGSFETPLHLLCYLNQVEFLKNFQVEVQGTPENMNIIEKNLLFYKPNNHNFISYYYVLWKMRHHTTQNVRITKIAPKWRSKANKVDRNHTMIDDHQWMTH